ncbi:MAG: hypothetical protein ACE5NP_13885, partial [Anaerolineae bacterium]
MVGAIYRRMKLASLCALLILAFTWGLAGCATGGPSVPTPINPVVTQTPVVPPPGIPSPGVILFVSDRDGSRKLYMMNVDGSAQALFNTTELGPDGGEASLSPDGTKLAVRSAEGVVVMRLQGGEPTVIHRGPHITGGPSWAPDGRIAFSQQVDVYGNGTIDEQDPSRVFVIDEDGGNLEVLPGDFFNVQGLAWSPTGTRLALSTRVDDAQSLITISRDGSNVMNLGAPALGAIDPGWSPDGSRVVFSSNFNIHVVKADGSDMHQLLSNAAR